MPSLSLRVHVSGMVDGKPLTEKILRGNADGVMGFFVGAWVGGGNPDFSLARVAPDGTASLCLKVNPGDVDTVKFAVSFNTYTPKSGRNCSLASHFIPVEDLLGHLRAAPAGTGGFDAHMTPLPMKDNFSEGRVFLRFRNAGTHLPAFAPGALKLRASSLRVMDRTNAAVTMMGKTVQDLITTQFAVCELNAGPQYVHSYSYWNMQQSLTTYALMGHLFSTMVPGVDLPWIMYDAYLAVHSTGLPLELLVKMPVGLLIVRFGIQVINRHTACALTSVYNTDYAMSEITGDAAKLKPTEDIGRTFGLMSMGAMGLLAAKPYSPAPGGAPVNLAGSLEVVAAAVRRRHAEGLRHRRSFPAVSDDCENLSHSIVQKASLLRRMYEGLLPKDGSVPPIDALAPLLCAQMDAVLPGRPLFRNITPADNLAMARVLLCLGQALHAGDWTVALTVVSAKGPAYTEGSPDAGASLSGHGTVVSRSRDPDGGWVYAPVEGTTYMVTNLQSPSGFVSEVDVPLEDGTRTTMPLVEYLTCLGQNLHQMVGSSPDVTILGHLKSKYPSLSACPFYVSAFYSGLKPDPKAIGCIPLDAASPADAARGKKDLFGAPVMGLSLPTTKAVPLTADMLGETPEEGAAILKTLEEQMEESYPPPMDSSHVLSSFWQPCPPPSGVRPCAYPHRHVECNWAFDDPADTEHAVRVYSALAQAFNDLQAATPKSDRVTASAFGQYLSAALRLHVPIPRAGSPYTVTAVHNMHLAAAKLGVDRLAQCPHLLKHVASRAEIPSVHHIYMCQQGEGPVHSHRVRFARGPPCSGTS